MTSLDEYLDSLDDDTLADHDVIRGEEDTAAALRQIGRLEDQVAALRQQARKARSNIDLWEQSETAPLLDRIKVLRAKLEGYAMEARQRDPRKKTHTTPYGIVKTREKQPEWVIEDEAALLKWALANDPDIIKTTHTLRLQELKKTYTVRDGRAFHPLTGEAAPGVRIEEPDGYSVNIHPNL